MPSNDAQASQAKWGRYQRRQYVINPTFQWKYITSLAVAAFILCSALSLALYGVLHQQARLRAINPEGSAAAVGAVILGFGIVFGMISAVGLGVWSLFITHRICGPLFVLSRYFEELATGCIPKPRPLRRKDEFKDLYAAFKKATDSLRAQRRSELAVLTEMEAEVESAARGDSEACRKALESVAMQLGDLRKLAAKSLGESVVDAPCTAAPAIGAAQTPVAVG